MSGHSKWSQIKHKKAITDKIKSRSFAKLSRIITIAARKGVDPRSNVQLSQAIERARADNMPNDNIQRAINRVGDKDSQNLEELFIEALGQDGIAIKIKAITDNRNRTMSELRQILGDFNFKVSQPGSLAWIFNQPKINLDNTSGELVSKLIEALDENDSVGDITSNIE